MCLVFVAGVIVGILAFIALISLTAREEPTGCALVFGSIIFLIFALIIIPQVVL